MKNNKTKNMELLVSLEEIQKIKVETLSERKKTLEDSKIYEFCNWELDAVERIFEIVKNLFISHNQDSRWTEILNRFLKDKSFRDEIIKNICDDLAADPEPFSVEYDFFSGEEYIIPYGHVYTRDFVSDIFSYGKGILEREEQEASITKFESINIGNFNGKDFAKTIIDESKKALRCQSYANDWHYFYKFLEQADLRNEIISRIINDITSQGIVPPFNYAELIITYEQSLLKEKNISEGRK